MEKVKEKVEYIMQERVNEYNKVMMRSLLEVRKDIAENKEYVQQLHNEVDKLERFRKKDRGDILQACVS
jgi:uncharacterized protein (DUF1697 family)